MKKGIINVNVVAELISERMVAEADANLKNYLEVESDFELEPLFEMLYDKFTGDSLPHEINEKLYQAAWAHPSVQTAIATIKQYIADEISSRIEYEKHIHHLRFGRL